MQQTRAEAVQLVTSEVQHHLPEWFGDDARLATTSPEVRKHKRSYIVRYMVDHHNTGRTGVLVKIPRPTPAKSLSEALRLQMPRTSTRREFDILVACSELLPRVDSSNLCAVRPLSYIPAWNAIAMEELKSRSLGDIRLRLPGKWSYRPEPFPVLLKRAGMWLSAFHNEMGELKPAMLTRMQLLSEFNGKLEELAQLIGRPQATSINKNLNDHITRFHDKLVPAARLHGDFKLGNILVASDGRLAAVDTKMRYRGPIFVDIAKLLSDLLTDQFSAISLGTFAKPEEWQEAFLSGYFESPEECDQSALRLYFGMAILEKWIWNEKLFASRSWGYQPIRIVLRRYFPRLLRKVLAS